MKHACHILRRTLLLALCLLLTLGPASAEGFRFSLEADIAPEHLPEELQPLMQGIAALLDVTTLDGTFVMNGTSFDLDAVMHMGTGQSASRTTLRLFGTDSHWGVRSSLLGDTELMINCGALLPFGQKARDHMGIPLDMAALAVPYTHVTSLATVAETLSPLFPKENGVTSLTRAELNAMINEVRRLSAEDAAFSRWLETLGISESFGGYCDTITSLSDIILPGLRITRTDNELTWAAGFIRLLHIKASETGLSATFSVPLIIDVSLSILSDGVLLTGTGKVQMGGIQANLSFSLPAALPAELPLISLSASYADSADPASAFSLLAEGDCSGSVLTMRLLDPQSSQVIMSVKADLTAFTPESLPDYSPEQLNGVNVLSVTSDSLHDLLMDIYKPLLIGGYDLLVAAPPEAVQALMDVLEDAGVIDLLTDSLAGGTGY